MLKKKKKVYDSFLYGKFTKQNSIFTLTDLKGNVKIIFSNGMNGFKNSKSKTKFATNSTAERLGKKAKSLGYKTTIFIINGKNKGRKRCIKFLKKGGLKVLKMLDTTPIIHNGCRPQKKPRR